jgi:7-cyano-7-deazaguanine synthase
MFIHTPLIELSKREIIERGLGLGVDYGMTLSCYDPTADGAACGRCDACQLRLKGFREAGLEDPAVYQTTGSPGPHSVRREKRA